MTKQKLINEVQIQVDRFHGLYHTTADCNERYAYSRAYNAMVVIREKIEQLPDVQPMQPQEPCKLVSNEYNICSCCDYNMNNLIEEIVVGCDDEDCGGECICCREAEVNQVIWTDKYMRFCPNCGRKLMEEINHD